MRAILLRKVLKYCATNTDSTNRIARGHKNFRPNKMLPSFCEGSSDSLMIIASMHFILSLNQRITCTKRNQKLEQIYQIKANM